MRPWGCPHMSDVRCQQCAKGDGYDIRRAPRRIVRSMNYRARVYRAEPFQEHEINTLVTVRESAW